MSGITCACMMTKIADATRKYAATCFFFAAISIVQAVPATSPCPSSCVLPNCSCASTDIPGGLTREQTPQIVLISFDDAIRVKDYEMFYSKILKGRTNPNGCNISITFFASHKDTDYSLAGQLAAEGHELAVHSVTHRTPTTFWSNDENNTQEVLDEIVNMQDILARWAHVSKDKVMGYRTPFLASSENQLKILYDNNFLYDCTMVTNEMYWPFTLDYKSPICNSPAVCPDESYPGLWVIPNINKVQNSSFSCSMIDSCAHPVKTKYGEWMYFFEHNFERHYNTTKAPFGLYAHSSWFYLSNEAERLQAYLDFLDYLGSLDDVYIVTMSQLIAWSQNPTPLSGINAFQPWQCPDTPPTSSCIYTDQTLCKYEESGEEQVVRLCRDDICPEVYPNITNPLGIQPTSLSDVGSSVTSTRMVDLTATVGVSDHTPGTVSQSSSLNTGMESERSLVIFSSTREISKSTSTTLVDTETKMTNKPSSTHDVETPVSSTVSLTPPLSVTHSTTRHKLTVITIMSTGTLAGSSENINVESMSASGEPVSGLSSLASKTKLQPSLRETESTLQGKTSVHSVRPTSTILINEIELSSTRAPTGSVESTSSSASASMKTGESSADEPTDSSMAGVVVGVVVAVLLVVLLLVGALVSIIIVLVLNCMMHSSIKGPGVFICFKQ